MKPGVVVTTFGRPNCLGRSLPQIARLGAPLLVVDDASSDPASFENARIATAHHAHYLRLPSNRGVACAINAGLAFWLGDPAIDWISIFQDDVDVHPRTFDFLERVQNSELRPLLSGHDAFEHQSHVQQNIGGVDVHLKMGNSGLHWHATRQYWAGVMPIPTPYLGAPKINNPQAFQGCKGKGADEDWWIGTHSPRSIVAQGRHIIVIPGLVRTFVTKPEDSTWGNGRAEDRPLRENP